MYVSLPRVVRMKDVGFESAPDTLHKVYGLPWQFSNLQNAIIPFSNSTSQYVKDYSNIPKI